jgi:hypothetical protein
MDTYRFEYAVFLLNKDIETVFLNPLSTKSPGLITVVLLAHG